MIATLRKYLIAGLLVWLPLAATLFIIKLFIDLMDMTILLLPREFHPENLWGFTIPGLGLVMALTVLILTGALVANLIGRKMVGIWEGLLGRIPLVRNIYNAFKQMTSTFLAADNKSFRRVVMVEFPRQGQWSLGFLSNTGINIESSRLQGDLVSVFISTTPNPTTGFLVLMPASEIIELDIGIEEAFKMIMSVGVVLPEQAIRELTPHKSVAQTGPGS